MYNNLQIELKSPLQGSGSEANWGIVNKLIGQSVNFFTLKQIKSY
jgi:hypothetical protein